MTHLLLIALLAITPFFASWSADATIVSTPKELVYENMAPGEQRTKFIEVTNQSSKQLKVLPQLMVTKPMISAIEVDIAQCADFQAIEPCNSPQGLLKLEAGEKKKLSVTVTIDRNLTEAFASSLGASELTFLAEEFVTPQDSNVITQEGRSIHEEEKLPRTGDELLTILAPASSLLLAGAVLLLIARRQRKAKDLKRIKSD